MIDIKLKGWMKNKKLLSGCVAIVCAAIIGGSAMYYDAANVLDLEMPAYVDAEGTIELVQEETPLAAPKITTSSKTSTKTSKKTVKVKKAATKTYTKNYPVQTQKASKTVKKNSTTTVKTDTVVKTAKTEKYTKKSKKVVVTTKVQTTVKTTTMVVQAAATSSASNKTTTSASSSSGSSTSSAANTNSAATRTTASSSSTSGSTTSGSTSSTSSTSSSANKVRHTADVYTVAAKMDIRVLNAFRDLGYTLIIDPNVGYAGYFDARTRSITLKEEGQTIYHELGHFLAFIAGNWDQTSSFKSIYSQEKSKYTAINKAYATQSSAEYFAESVLNYTTGGSALKASRPKTYNAIADALNTVTTTSVSRLRTMYMAVGYKF